MRACRHLAFPDFRWFPGVFPRLSLVTRDFPPSPIIVARVFPRLPLVTRSFPALTSCYQSFPGAYLLPLQNNNRSSKQNNQNNTEQLTHRL